MIIFHLIVTMVGLYVLGAEHVRSRIVELNDAVSPLPGSNFVTKSINIWRMNPFYGSSDSGFGKDLFVLTYKRGKECIKGGYRIADAICSDYVPLENTNFNEVAGHVASSVDYQIEASKSTEFDKSVSLSGLETEIDFFDASLKSNQEFSFAAEFASNHKSNIVIKHAICNDYRVTVSDYIAPDSLGYFELDPELVQSVKELPVDGDDLTPYVKWLVKYGSHRIKELTNGAKLTETSYFTESDYSLMVKEVADVEMAAQESTWCHTTSKSGSYNESVQATTFDKYCYGVQHYSAHGEVPADNDPSGWLEKVRRNPVPIRMALTPIFDIFTSSWFDDPNIAKKQLNLARASQDYCNPIYNDITGGCYSPPPPPVPVVSVTDHYVLQGKGDKQVKLAPMNSSFCFITEGLGWFAGGEACRVVAKAGEPNDTTTYWYLTSGSGQDDFKCGARCVVNFDSKSISPEYSTSGAGQKSMLLTDSRSSICFLVNGQAWGEGYPYPSCNIHIVGSSWQIDSYGYYNAFKCSARCLSLPNMGQPTYFLLNDKGTAETVMEEAVSHLCYLTRGRYWYRGGEECRIDKRFIEGKTGEYWILHKGSGQSAMECGATCIPFNFSS